MNTLTPNAFAIALSSFHRSSENEESSENWIEVVSRVINRQRFLWERSLGRILNQIETDELTELSSLIERKCILPDERTLWLSGTDLSLQRESCMFNSAFIHIETVYDMVDLFWLLLQGCNVGFLPITGALNGFRCPLDAIEIIRSSRQTPDGRKTNVETYDKEEGIWTIQIGDSAEAFAKAVGKLIAGKYPAKKLIINLSEIRPFGSRLKGYGWASAGDEPLAQSFYQIAKILSQRADQLLTKSDILEIIHFLGEIPSYRPLSQLALFEYGESEYEEWKKRQSSMKSAFLFHMKPTKEELQKLFHLILESGGNEPGIINAREAKRRAPWFKGCNPSGDVLLGNKSFCSFVEVNLLAFQGDKVSLEKALLLAARMNYRQTLISLKDEILQETWHLNNEFLHLCGVSLSGIRARPDLTAYDYKRMRNITVSSAFGMARELNTPLPKNVTCVSFSSALTKVMGTKAWGDVSEGIHAPIGKYLFHLTSFGKQDPVVTCFKSQGYDVSEKPYEPNDVLVKLPAAYFQVPFTKKCITRNGKIEEIEINTESALDQLKWYAELQETWSEQNISNTIYYDPSEVPEIIDWLSENWDSYVRVSFAFRNDPLKSAQDLGLPYLEQEAVSEETYKHYIAKIAKQSEA